MPPALERFHLGCSSYSHKEGFKLLYANRHVELWLDYLGDSQMLMYLFPDLFNMDLFSIYYMPGPVLAAGYLRLHQTVMVSALTEPR